MSEAVVRFEHVTKKYRRVVARPFLLRNALKRIVGRGAKPELFSPLDDVSFELRSGESIGIIGRNGAGKSTLLRLISGGCIPTGGTIAVRGRVAPVLAVGVAFHPDMTGRECIDLNARILGFTSSEIRTRRDEIVAFAELERFLDTPVRHYSSGMQARLGFSVAINADADLLLIDEILAVGDHAFQEKCSARLAHLREGGTTIVMVSHAAETVRRMCTRVLWLKDGRIALDGGPDLVCDAYLQSP